ncbi:MAG: hypothetical protein ABWX85_04570 [Arthrobacter sp.]
MNRILSKRVKEQQIGRAEHVCTPEFLDRYVRPHVGGAATSGGAWTTRVIQLGGTGAATVQVELNGGAPVFAKLFPFEDGSAVHAKLQALRAAGLGQVASQVNLEGGSANDQALGWSLNPPMNKKLTSLGVPAHKAPSMSTDGRAPAPGWAGAATNEPADTADRTMTLDTHRR